LLVALQFCDNAHKRTSGGFARLNLPGQRAGATRCKCMKQVFRLLTAILLLGSAQAFAISVPLDGTRTVLTGTDCGIATYRFGTTASWNGINLDLYVEVNSEDNDLTGLDCVYEDSGVLSVRLRDMDVADDVAFMDLTLTLVQQGTLIPVDVDRITATGFDLDANGVITGGTSTGTDDIYVSGPGASFVSNATNVTYSQGAFPGGHNIHLEGQAAGNCLDSPLTPVPSCRASASWIGSTPNIVSSISVRFQNDNAYGQYTGTFNALRLLQLSLQDVHAEELLAETNDRGDTPASYGDAVHQIVSLNAILGYGLAPDNDPAMQSGTPATGDDNDAAANIPKYDDEDAVFRNGTSLLNQTFTAGENDSIDVNTFGSGFLSVWIDFNGDGDFTDAGEQPANDIAINSATSESTNVPFTVPFSATGGTTYFRVRFSAAAGVGPSGLGGAGEVEDYRIFIDPMDPEFNMAKTSDTAIITAPGTITYTFEFTNTGNVTLTNLTLSDPDIDSGSLSGCPIASLAPNGVASCTATRTISQTQIDNGAALTNTATANATDPAGDSTSDSDPSDNTASTTINATYLSTIDKPTPAHVDNDSSGDISVGDDLNYTITATNTGTGSLTNFVVSDSLITPGSNTCVTVAPGATCQLIGTYTVTASDVTAGSVLNTATAESDQTTAITDDVTVPLPQPSHSITKALSSNADEDGSGDVSVSDTLTYTVTAVNDGTANLTSLQVSDNLITPSSTVCALVIPGASCVLTGTYVVTAADIAAGSINNTASAESDQTASTDDTETVAVPNAALSIVKPAPANADEDASTDISLGDTLTYTVTATNSGTSNLTNVVVNDPLLTPSSASCALVAPGATCVLSGTYSVSAADIAAGNIDNTATADSDQTDPVDDSQTVVVPTPQHTLDKVIAGSTDTDSSGDLSAGDALSYTITATNTGTATLTNLVLTDSKITPNTITCASVAPGSTCVLNGSYTVTAADVTAGTVDNQATSVSDQTAQVDADESVSLPAPALAINKPAPINSDEDGSGDVSAGDTLTYTITASNTGSANLTNVLVADTVITPSSNTCALVAPGANCVLTGSYAVTAADIVAGSIVNEASANSDQTDEVTDDETVSPPTPDLQLDKAAPSNADEDGSTDVSAGDTLTYIITATNNGTSNLTNVVVSDAMLTPGSSSCASVAPGATCVLTGTYVVTPADVLAGSIVNTASAESDQTVPVQDTETVTTPTPSHTIDKAAPGNADEDASTDISVGDTLTYNITATNNGTATLTNLIVSDSMISPATVTCASVPPSGACLLTGTYVVTAADVLAGSINNTASAESDQTPSSDDSETVLVPSPAHSIDKAAPSNTDEDASGDVSLGDTLTYTITATNTGAALLTNLVVSDAMLTPASNTCASVAVGATCVLTGTYSVTAADVAAGNIVNTASSISDQTPALDDTETVVVPTPAHSIDKAAPSNADEDASSDISVGDTLTYTITATNTGTAVLTNLAVTDAMLTPSSNSCASVAPGATCLLVGTYSVVAADVAAGSIVNTAGSVSDQTAPLDDTETVNLPQPGHAIDKPAPANADEDASGDVSVGDTLTYTITANNTGSAVLTNFIVSDPLITPASITCPTVVPGGNCILVGTYVVTASDVAAGVINNTASSDTDQTDSLDDSQVVNLLQPGLGIDKPAPINSDEDGSADISVGDTLTYTITATNTGTATLTNVVVSDPLITPATVTCASVAAGATCVLTGTYSVSADDIAAGSIDNLATAVSDQTAAVTDDETVPVPAPSLALDKPAPVNTDEDSSADVSVGDTLTYTITATNTGTATLTNVVVSDPLITPSSTSCATLSAGTTCVLTGIYTVTPADVAAGSIDNTATAESDQTTPVSDVESVPTPTPSHSINKPAPAHVDTDTSGDISAGDTLNYTITVVNTGSATLTNMVVSDPLITPGTVTCATLAPGASCVLAGSYVVTAADVVAGSVVNTATSDSDQTDPLTDDETVALPAPAHTLDKPAPSNADNDGSTDVSAGDVLSYTVTATNTGTATLTNLLVSDPLITPSNTTCATVAPGATCVLSGTYTVTTADVAAGSIDNTASSASDQTTVVTDDQSVPVPSPALTIDKSAPSNGDQDGSTDVSAGDILTYTITATNAGTSVLTNVFVDDPLITPGSQTCASVVVGATCVLTGTYVVTAADVSAGAINNTATADSDQTPQVSDDEVVVVPAPALGIDKAAPSNADADGSTDISVGDVLSYTVTATNTGTSILTNVLVSDPLLSPGSTSCASVAIGATCILVGTYTVAASDVVAGSINNTASANSDQTEAVSDTEIVAVPEPSHILSKAVPSNADEDASGDVSVGDTLTYVITATNNGTAVLTNMVVNDPLITPSSTTCASLAPGATCVLSGTYTVTLIDVAAGTINNTASSDTDQTDPVDDSQTLNLNAPSHAIDKAAPTNTDEDGSGDISAGDTLTYSITATNNGAAALTNLVVSDPLINPSTNTCSLVAPGATCVLVGNYVVTPSDVDAGVINNTASSDSDQTDPLSDTETVNLPAPALALDKTAPTNADEDASGDISVGDTLTYTIIASNNGSATLTNVLVSDPLIAPNSTTCATLASGADCVLTGTYVVVASDITAGSIDNTASADSDQTGPLTDNETVPVPSPDLAISKPAPVNADNDASNDVSAGDVLTYTVTATNTGTATLTNLLVSDPLLTPNSINCAVVPSGGTCVLTGTYTATPADVVAGAIVNTASAISDQTDSVSDDETVSLPAPAHTLDKALPSNADEDSSSDISSGDTLTYTITATNSGTANLTNLTISDPLIAPATITCATVAPGATCVLVGDYTVNASDVAAGSIDNTATSGSDQTGPVDDAQTVVIAGPSHTIDKPAPVNTDNDGSIDVSAGDILTYTITATNNGSANLTSLIVSDPMISPSSTTCALVTPGDTCVLVGTYAVTGSDVIAGSIDNTASSVSDQTAALSDDESVPVPSPLLGLDKAAPVNADNDGTGDLSAGDVLTYTIAATNSGSANLTNVVITDTLITPSTNSCALLAPGAACTLVGSYTVTAADVLAGSVVNTASAQSDQTPTLDDTEITPMPGPAFELVKAQPVNADEDGSTDISIGDTLTYTITATNIGNANLTNLVVNDSLITPNTVNCPAVAVGANCQLIGTYTVTAADVAAGTIENTADADSDQTDPQNDAVSVPVPMPSHAIDKPAPGLIDNDASNDVSVGDVLNYTITATNTGTAQLTNLVVSDPLITPNTNTCALVAPGGTCVLTGSYTVTPADVVAGAINNTASSDSDQTGPLSDDQVVVVPVPSLQIDKPAPANADEDGSTDISVGDTLTYTITATNNGTSNLTNVVVNDAMIAPSSAFCALLAPAATCVLTGDYVVTAADVAAGSIVNTATSDSDQTAAVDDSQTVMPPTPSHTLVKSVPDNADEDGSGDVSVGDTLTYVVTATNNGTATLTNMIVSDEMITPDSIACPVVAPAANCVLAGTYVVTAADVVAGSIENTASSVSDQTEPVDDTQTQVLNGPSHTISKAYSGNADEDGSTDISTGDTLSYTVTASNNGNATLTNLIVSDAMLTPSVNTCAIVAPGADCVLAGTYVATAADVIAGSIDNTASSVSDQTAALDDTETVVLPTPVLEISKALPLNADEDASGDISVGDTLNYIITASNNGTAVLTNVVVDDSLITPSSQTCALLQPGADCVLQGSYTVAASDISAGSINNTATADSDQTQVVDDSVVVNLAEPAIELVKALSANADEDASGDISVGDTLTYTATASNVGATSLTNVVVSDNLITPSSTSCALVSVGGTCVLSGTYTVIAADLAAGVINNTATADADQTDSVADNVVTTLAAPALTLNKSFAANADEDASGDISEGDTLTYNIVATNTGSATLTMVSVTDSKLSPSNVVCATVAPLANCSLSGAYVVTAADVAAGVINNTASADSDQTNPIEDSVQVTPAAPGLTLVKPAPVNNDVDQSGDVTPGDILSYTISATNTGSANLTNVVVNDSLLTPSSTSCALLTSGQTCVLTGNYTVTVADAANGEIVNTATATSDQTPSASATQTEVVNTPPVTVDPPEPPVTQDDSETNQPLGQPVTVSVLGDDSDPENNIDPTTVVIIDPTTGDPVTSLVVPGEGTWVVDPVTGDITFTPEPGYLGDPTPIVYTVTDTTGLASNPSTVTIDYEEPATLTGTVWLDSDRDGQIDANEALKPGWTLEILDDQGNVVATVVTDANGEYSVAGLIPGQYTVKFYNEAGVFIADSQTNGPLLSGDTQDLPLPVDPSGVIYDSASREPVEGVTLQLINSAGVPVDEACLGANQQGQTTQTDGLYAFDVYPNAHPSCPDGETFEIVIVSVPPTHISGFSNEIPPQNGVFDSDSVEANCTVDTHPSSGACEVQAQPDAPVQGEDTSYFTRFTLSTGDTNVIFNHIAIDPFVESAVAALTLQKAVSTPRASTGDVIYYTIRVENTIDVAALDVSVKDDLPRGFRIVEETAKVAVFDANAEQQSTQSAVSVGVDPVVFLGLDIPALGEGYIEISYAVRIGAGVVQGNYANTAEVSAGGTSNVSTARVEVVADPVLHQSTLVGKVFHDRDGDGYQESAFASDVTIKSDYFGWSSHHAGDLSGRVSAFDEPENHELVVFMPLTGNNSFSVSTAEGTFINVDHIGEVTESHVGKRAHGITAQQLRISTRKTRAVPTPTSKLQSNTEEQPVLEITVQNIGINEEGIPGVRLATVEGLLIETDQAGRFHLPDVDTGNSRIGKQFIVKLDTTTLPEGAVMSTENPRVLRITSSALNTIRFGVKLPAQQRPAGANPVQERKAAVEAKLGSVFFDTDMHNIRADQRGVVEDIIKRVKQFKRARIIIEAHTDSRHNMEYNIALAERRARTVERELRKVLGDELMNNVSVEVDKGSYEEVIHNDPRAIDFKGDKK